MDKKDIDLESLRGFTPGPWSIDWNVTRLDIYGSDERTLIATLRRSALSEGVDAAARANARLIAAAPALLAELTARRARDKWAGELPPLPEPEYGDTDCHSGYSVQQVHDYARAAIAALQAQQPGAQAVVIPEPSDEDVEAAWVAFQANIPRNTMRALLSNDRARLRERIGQAPGGDGDA